MRKTIDKQGIKYRGCHKDCNGCIYQVKAMVGRQHGCWCTDWPEQCAIIYYYTEAPKLLISV